MKVNREDLLKRLLLLKPGLSNKGRIVQSESVIFSQGHIASFNNDYLVAIPFEADFEGAVRAEELTAILSKLGTDEIDISCENGKIIIKAGRSKSGICHDDFIRLPIAGILESKANVEMIPLPEGFISAVKRCAFCASNDLSDVLTGVYIKDGIFSACNSYRAIRINVSGADTLPKFLLPASCASFLGNYELTEIGVSNSWAFFAGVNGLSLCIRLVSPGFEGYPDLEKVFNNEGGKDLFLPEKLVSAIEKARIFLKTSPTEGAKSVLVAFKQGRIVLRGEGVYGFYEEQVAAKEYQGEEISFQINPDFLADIVPLVQTARLVDNARLIFEGQDFKYVSALCVEV